MTSSTTSPVAVSRRVALGVPVLPWDAIAAWALSFGLVFYLALRGGGYDVVIRDQVAILVWWLVLLLAVAGLAPRLTRGGWAALAVLAAWAGWTALGIPGSESAERTLGEAGRLSAYAGVLALALALQGRAGLRHVLNGVATAIGLVTAMAVLSRLHPQWFPANDQLRFLPTAARRLSYPLNYWNGLAGFMAMGAALLLGVAATARTRAGQLAAAAALPLAGLGDYLCVSRGGAIVLAVGVLAFFALAHDRLARLATILVAGAGTAILVAAASQRDALQTGIDTPAARHEGTELIWLCLIVCAGVGLVHVAITLLARHAERPRVLRVSRPAAGAATAALVVVALAGLFGTSLHSRLGHAWHEFKAPPAAHDVSSGDVFARLQGTRGQGRWQYWQAAAKEYRSDRLRGTGGGTFELWWARHATVPGTVHDAHSLYLQTLGETGLVGAVLLGLLVLLSLGGGAVRALGETGSARTLLAAATAAAAVFWVHAAVEWHWQMTVIPVALMFVLAAIAGHRAPTRRAAGLPVRVLLVAAAIAAFVPIALGLSTTQLVRQSQSAAQAGRVVDAVSDARRADRLPGTSAAAMLQEALALEQGGAVRAAEDAAVRASRAEPTNWRPWLVRARLEARLGDSAAALAHFRRARALDPRSTLFGVR